MVANPSVVISFPDTNCGFPVWASSSHVRRPEIDKRDNDRSIFQERVITNQIGRILSQPRIDADNRRVRGVNGLRCIRKRTNELSA